MKISNRLKKIASFVLKTEDAYLLDVGCDHALLAIYVALNNPNIKIVASDINEGPLEQARKNVLKYNLDNRIELVLGDGLDVINDNINTISISGMGTSTILDILKKDKLKLVRRLIISSNNDHYILRKKIVEMGFYIKDEDIIYENGKYYPIIVFEKGNAKYKKIELEYGPILIKDKSDIFINYMNFIKNKKINILKCLGNKYFIKKLIIKKEIRDLNKII